MNGWHQMNGMSGRTLVELPQCNDNKEYWTIRFTGGLGMSSRGRKLKISFAQVKFWWSLQLKCQVMCQVNCQCQSAWDKGLILQLLNWQYLLQVVDTLHVKGLLWFWSWFGSSTRMEEQWDCSYGSSLIRGSMAWQGLERNQSLDCWAWQWGHIKESFVYSSSNSFSSKEEEVWPWHAYLHGGHERGTCGWLLGGNADWNCSSGQRGHLVCCFSWFHRWPQGGTRHMGIQVHALTRWVLSLSQGSILCPRWYLETTHQCEDRYLCSSCSVGYGSIAVGLDSHSWSTDTTDWHLK